MRGWLKNVGKKLAGAKTAVLSARDSFSKPMANPKRVKPLYDYQNELHAIENQHNAVMGRLHSVRDKIVAIGKVDATKFYKSAFNDFKEAGGNIAKVRPPINMTDAVVKASQLKKAAAKIRFQREGIKSGLLGRATNPNYRQLKTNYRELETRPGEHLAVLPHHHGVAEQVFSAHAEREYNRIMRLALAGKNWSTAAIMYTPSFHIQNIGSRFLPMLMRSPARWGGTAQAFRAAMRDMEDPERIAELGRHGFIRLSPRGWNEKFSGGTQHWLMGKGIIGRTAAHLVHGYGNALHQSINFMGHVTYHIALQDFLKDGHSLEVAEQLAGHKTSVMMGTIARDMMSKGWRQTADALLFSTRYSTTTLDMFGKAVVKDPAMRNRLSMMGIAPEKVEAALKSNRRDFQKVLAKDIAAMLAFSNAMNYMMTSYYNMPDKNGKKGGHFIWDNPGSTWYSDLVNVKYVTGVDKQTGRPDMAGTPFRSTRDILEDVMEIPAIITGEPTNQNNVAINKTNQFWKIALDMATGRDWKGTTLDQPTAAETVASRMGDVIDNLSPISARQYMIDAVSRMEGGDPAYKAVAKAWVDQFSDMDIHKMWLRALGTQLSLGEKPGQPVGEAGAAKEKFTSWAGQPGIQQAIRSGDPNMRSLFIKHALAAGLSGEDIKSRLQYIMRPKGQGVSKGALRYQQQQNP